MGHSCRRTTVSKLLILSGFLFPYAAKGQLSNDLVPRERTVPTREAVKAEVEQRRFRLGPFRLNPVFRLSNAGYDSNIFGGTSGNEVHDWTATATAGVRWVVPVGYNKLFVRGEALPQYTWYREHPSLRELGGIYRASLLGFFNRASLDVGGYNSRTVAYVSSETETKAIQTTLGGSARVEVDIASNLSVFGGVDVARIRFGTLQGQPIPISTGLFDRREAAARGGFRYRLSSSWDVTAAYEKTRVEFVDVPAQRDNQSDGYLIGIHYDRPRFFANLSGGYRRGHPYNGSSYPDYSTGTGSYFASYFLTRKVEVQAYGDRRVSYGLTSSQYIQTRNGGGLNVQVHPKVLLRGFGEYGTNEFPAVTSGALLSAARTDKTANYGGGFSAIVYRKVVLTALASEYQYRSTQPGLDRNVLRFSTALSFEGLFSR